jgi:ATP-dependent RNA helicase DDX51/DBP6
MFSVNRFDPRKEDARKSIGAIDQKKKKSKLRRSTDNQSDVKKKRKKRKRDSKISDGEEDENRQANTEVSSSTRIATEASATEVEAKVAEQEIEPEQESVSNAPGVDHTPTETEIETEPMTEAAFRVIAPETDGALSSKKNLSAKITAEAFDDLDLTDDAWHASSSSKKKNSPLEEIKDGDEYDESQPAASDPTDEIERALDMTRLPIVEAAKRWGMADFLVRNLRSNGHEHFFPIQALVIPDVIVAERHMTSLRVRDVCCAAPTGSGKTLAFVLPVLNALASRRVRRLRALVILPSRDLAQQVYRVFDDYRKGSENDLRIGLAIGQTDFKAEQKKLILGDDDDGSGKSACESRNRTQLRYSMDPGNLDLALDAMGKELELYNDYDASGRTREWKKHRNEIPPGGISAVDVLVCTPGRLVDHLDNTPGFTLQHLRWLIIDEADRLLSQSYHGWIQRVLDCVHEPPMPPKYHSDDGGIITIDPVTHRRSEQDAFVTTTSLSTTTEDGTSSIEIGASTDICQRIQLRKLLYSATLTKDPQKLSSLRLVNPKYFNAHDLKRRQNAMSANKGNNTSGDHGINNNNLYRMPEQLKECTVECTAEQKPLVLLALLLERLNEYREVEESSASSVTTKKSTIVVFASSLESTHRLTRLLQLLWQAADYNGTPPVEFSSALNQHQRSLLMKRCNDPKDRSVSVLVCSDGMSRGMDLASCRAVIHYDVPGMAKTYVHRCGRTARAGLDGTAIALLKGKGQAGQFMRLRRLIALPERVTKASVKTSLVREAIPLYKHCVSRLREVLAAEDRNELKATDPNLTRFLPSDHCDDDEDSSASDSSGDSGMSLE